MPLPCTVGLLDSVGSRRDRRAGAPRGS